MQIALMVLRPLLVGLLIAAVLVVYWRRRGKRIELTGGVRGAATVAFAVAVFGMVVVSLVTAAPLLGFSPDWSWLRYREDIRFEIVGPLVLGIVSAAILLAPSSVEPAEGRAALSRRTALSFVRRAWLLPGIAALALVLATTVIAGRASLPDDEGRYTMHSVDIGVARIGTVMYGWFFSVPALIALTVLLVVCVWGLWRLARPPMAPDDPEKDAAVRRQRSMGLIALVTGALFVHLGAIWLDLAASASMYGGVATNDGWVHTGSDFAALSEPLWWAGHAAAAVGYGYWCGWLLALALPRARAAGNPGA